MVHQYVLHRHDLAGTDEERGVKKWRKRYTTHDGISSAEDTTYDLPFIMGCLRRQKWTAYVPFLPTFKYNLVHLIKRCCKVSRFIILLCGNNRGHYIYSCSFVCLSRKKEFAEML